MSELTKEECQVWKIHPITKVLLKYTKSVHTNITDVMLNPDTIQNTDSRAILNKWLGYRLGLEEVIHTIENMENIEDEDESNRL